jgi:hypothetical protein
MSRDRAMLQMRAFHVDDVRVDVRERRGPEAGLVANLQKAPLLVVMLPKGEIVLPKAVVVPDDAAPEPMWKSTSVSGAQVISRRWRGRAGSVER